MGDLLANIKHSFVNLVERQRTSTAFFIAMVLAFTPILGLMATQSVNAAPNTAQIRVHQKLDLNANGALDWDEGPQHIAGWTIRLYNASFEPQNYGNGGTNEVVTTNQPYDAAARFEVPAAQDFVICEVLKDGYTPSVQTQITGWVSTAESDVANGSGNADEAPVCISVAAQEAGQISAYAFGNLVNHVVPAAASQSTQVVVPSDFANTMTTWTYHDDTADAFSAATPTETEKHKIAENPEMSPGDYGAVNLNVEPGDKWNLATLLYAGTELADISELGFRVNTSNPGQAYLNIDVDFDNTAPSTVGFQGRLVYVPNPTPTVDNWHNFEAIDGGAGVWTWSRFDENGNQWPDGNTNANRTWAEIVTNFPRAEISNVESAFDFGGVFFRADGDGGDSTTFYDWAYLATATENTIYNFEPQTLEDGEIRIHAVNDVDEDGLPDWDEDESHQAGWDTRLYNASWTQVDSVTTTGLFFENSAKMFVQPGTYYICEVLQDGYTYSFGRTITGWLSWPDTSVTNQSAAGDETEGCITVDVYPGQFSSHVFGNIPPEETTNNQQPEPDDETETETETDNTNNNPSNNQNNNQNDGDGTGDGNPAPQGVVPATTTVEVLGATTDDQANTDNNDDGQEDDEDQESSSATTETGGGGEVLGAQDTKQASSFNLWWLLALAIPALFWLIFTLFRREEDDEQI